MTIKEIKENILADEVTYSKGVFTARTGFFYTHGRTVQDLIDKVKEIVPEANVIDQGEVWKNFNGGASLRASSHWFVKFTI